MHWFVKNDLNRRKFFLPLLKVNLKDDIMTETLVWELSLISIAALEQIYIDITWVET